MSLTIQSSSRSIWITIIGQVHNDTIIIININILNILRHYRMDYIREFLENSTIHGLTYISSAKSWLVKCVWVFLVVCCFLTSWVLILGSFSSWNTSPVGTTVETRDIKEIRLPNIIVCPPKDSTTALNADLEHIQDFSLSFY